MPNSIDHETDETMSRRKDDSFMRKLATSVAIAIVTQALVTIYYAGKLSNQVGNNTIAISRFTDKMDSQNTMAVQIAEIKSTVNFLANSISKFGDKLNDVASEQQKRGPLVYGKDKK